LQKSRIPEGGERKGRLAAQWIETIVMQGMTQPPNFKPPATQLPEAEAQDLIRRLRRKEQTWVDWGWACQMLQKSGYSTQTIFEETGFEPLQQNQVIVAAQVYESLVKGDASEAVQTYFQQRGSDILYELRSLDQARRIAAAEFALTKKLDQDSARDLAKAFREFSYFAKLPQHFTDSPGDAVAYWCWKRARERSNLQERSRLIAQGLQFVESASARQQLEQLLTDFTVVKTRNAPMLPLYRLEQDEELPCLVAVAGQLPLSPAAIATTSLTAAAGPFQVTQIRAPGAYLMLPGWQKVRAAQEPLAIMATSADLPGHYPGNPEPVMLFIDRAQTDWTADDYFLIEQEQLLQVAWFAEPPPIPLLAKVVLILRPKRILDEAAIAAPWQLDE
jgi:hypothetical protein